MKTNLIYENLCVSDNSSNNFPNQKQNNFFEIKNILLEFLLDISTGSLTLLKFTKTFYL